MATAKRRAAIYLRISQDRENLRLGVDRQRGDAEALIKARRWQLIDVYEDNDTSGTGRKERPGFERLLRDIEEGCKSCGGWSGIGWQEVKDMDLRYLGRDGEEPDGCFVTNRLIVDDVPVGYMYREHPDEDTRFGAVDSGWRFFAGDETDEYVNNPNNISLASLSTFCRANPECLPFLSAPYGSAFFRGPDGQFIQEAFEAGQE